MSAIEFEVLRDNHERLVNELGSSVLINHLFQNGLINDDELEEIRKKGKKGKEGAEEMMKIIYESGANAFPKLVKSLEEAGYKEMSLKLVSDLIQKKEEENHNCQEMDLSSVTFPEYPHLPCVKSDAIQDDKVLVELNEEYKKSDKSEELWFNSMCDWFNDHNFSSKEVLKLVVKDWLVKIEEVVERGCLERNEFNFYIDLTDRVKDDDYFQLLRSLLLSLYFLTNRLSNYTNKMSREDLIHSLKKDREMYHEYHRDAFNQIKHNLEVIIGEKNGDMQPIDISNCKLAEFLYSVVYDVRNIWESFRKQ